EREARAVGRQPHRRHVLVREARGVVGVDGEEGDAGRGVVAGEGDEALGVAVGPRADVAPEGDAEAVLAGEAGGGDGAAGGAREREGGLGERLAHLELGRGRRGEAGEEEQEDEGLHGEEGERERGGSGEGVRSPFLPFPNSSFRSQQVAVCGACIRRSGRSAPAARRSPATAVYLAADSNSSPLTSRSSHF